MKYLTYEEYVQFGGSLVSSTDFDKYELRARAWLNGRVLPQRVAHVLETIQGDNVRMAMKEIIDIQFNYDLQMENAKKADGAIYSGLSSETVKDHTVSFNTSIKNVIGQLDKDTIENQNRVVNQYLQLTGLLYRGL